LVPESTQLTRCSIILPWNIASPEQTVGAMERFHKSRIGMTHLHIDVSHHRMVSKECSMHHADTLRTFFVGTGQLQQPCYYSFRDLKDI
jgi:hypothetical protein